MKIQKREITKFPSMLPEAWKSFADNDFLCFLATDRKNRITYINHAGEKMYGYRAKELIGEHVSILYKGIKLVPSIAGLILKKSRIGKPWEAEIWNVRKDGTQFPIWIATHYLYDSKGRRIGALSISRDISSDVWARGQAQYLAGLAQQIEMALISTDKRGNITSINRAGERLFGYKSEEILGKSIRTLYSKKNPAERIRSLRSQMADGRGYIAQLYRRRKDGSEFLTWLSTAPLYDDKGGLNGFLGIGRDITEEAEAREEIEYMAELVNRAHFCILSTDIKNRIRSINPAGERMYGYQARELVGKDRSILYRGLVLSPEKLMLLKGKMKKGQGWVAELDNVRRNGEVFPVRLATAYLYDDRGRRKGAVSIAQDITEEQLLRDRLIESAKLVSLGQAAAGIAHEINNPLNALMNIAHILSRVKCLREDEGKVQLLTDLRREIGRLERLSSEFLQFARPRPLKKEMVDINRILKDVVRLFRYDKKPGRSVTFVERLKKIEDVPADASRLNQVAMNLIRNASQAVGKRGRVTVSSFRNSDTVGFTVRDNGPGISREVREKMFEPFFSTKTRGAGLGMAVTKQIIDQHRGTIRVQSSPGAGTAVTVTIPKKEYSNA